MANPSSKDPVNDSIESSLSLADDEKTFNSLIEDVDEFNEDVNELNEELKTNADDRSSEIWPLIVSNEVP